MDSGIVVSELILQLRYYVHFQANTLGKGMNNKIIRCPRGVMVKAIDSGIVVSELILQLRYYVHFRANTLGKGMNPLILPAMG